MSWFWFCFAVSSLFVFVVWLIFDLLKHRCPACRYSLRRGASKCHHCGESVDEAVTSGASPAEKSLGRIALASLTAFVVLTVIAFIAGQFQR